MTDPTQPLLLPHRTPPLLEKPKRKSRLGLIGLTALGVFAVVAGVGIASRATEENNLKKQTRADAVQTVAVIDAENGAETQDIVLPGTVQAWHEAVIYARTGGYLKDWKTDIGDKVKEGDVLAEIDAPDLDAQFRQAQADLNTAIANNRIAQITAKRYAELSKSDSVSRQQADQAQATADADVAAAQSSKANLDHLQEEENFKTVVAPFDGTITARNVDVGALINGGNSGAGTGQDMFHIAETSKLRVYVQVPENEATAITTPPPLIPRRAPFCCNSKWTMPTAFYYPAAIPTCISRSPRHPQPSSCRSTRFCSATACRRVLSKTAMSI
jgi:multidrug efflux pump subunit AcrA (membrane-fusion protein)